MDANAERLVIERIEKLERRIAELEAKLETKATAARATTATTKPELQTELIPVSPPLLDAQLSARRTDDFFRDTTFNVTFDGYYEYKLADGFLLRGEYRRDWSNQPFFLTEQPGVLKKEQNTATLGLVWWLGRKQGTW